MDNVYPKSINPQVAYLFQTHLSGDGLIQFSQDGQKSALHKEIEIKVEKLKYNNASWS